MKKQLRQAKIEQLIKKYPIENQDKLLKYLKKEGINATQATISRDIGELKITKKTSKDGKTQYYTVFQDEFSVEKRLQRAIYDSMLSITKVEFMTIIKTKPKNANGLAAIIDDMDDEKIVATLAGYDTLVLISSSSQDATIVYEMFNNLFLDK